jgi:hypothetical protein
MKPQELTNRATWHSEDRNAPMYFAGELADAFSDAVDADEALQNEHLQVAILVGAVLAGEGHPGRWDLIDMSTLYAQLPDPRPESLIGLSIILTAMLGWMAIEGLLPRRCVAGYFDAIEDLAPSSPGLDGFVAATRDAVSGLARH